MEKFFKIDMEFNLDTIPESYKYVTKLCEV